MEVPQKKKKIHHVSSDFTSGYLSEENKNTNPKKYMHPHVRCSTIYSSQDVEAT